MAVLTDRQALGVAVGGTVLVVGGIWYARRKMAAVADAVQAGVGAVAEAVNPADSGNLVNRVHEWWWQNTVGRVTGQKEGGIGIWLADVLNPPPNDEGVL